MNRKTIIRLGLAILFAAVLTSCKTITGPDDGGGSSPDTTKTGKGALEQVLDMLS